MQTVHDLVRLAAERTPNHIAIVDDRIDRQTTYAEMIDGIDAVAAGLRDIGIDRGQFVATVLPNLFEHAIILLALQRLGAIPALINPRLKPDEVAQLISDGRLTAAIILANADMIQAVAPVLPPAVPVVTIGGGLAASIDFDTCRGDPSGLGPVPAHCPDDVAFVFYTSGTTGLPKGVMVPHRAADSRVLYVATQCGLRHGSHNRAIGLMPLFHVVGFYSCLVATLAFNGTYYVCSAFDPAAVVDAVDKHKISFLYGAPTHFHALLGSANFSPERVASVETLVYAGAMMPGPLLDRVGESFSARITNIYGTTEVMNALYMTDPVGHPNLYRPGFYSNVRIGRIGGGIDEHLGVGEEGELLVDATADASFTGYLNRPDATAEKVENGWYRTGDVGVLRGDGDIELRGRVDDMIVTGAENVHPDEVEAILLLHPCVRDVAVIGIPDERWGERVVAFIVPDDNAPADADLDAYCRSSTLANYKRPREYVTIEDIPRNAANKVLRRELKARLASDARRQR